MDLGAMAMKGYCAFPKALELLASLSDCLLSYQDTDDGMGDLTLLQRTSRCILQPQLPEPQDTRWGMSH